MKNCLDSDGLRAVQFLVNKVKKQGESFFKNAVIDNAQKQCSFVEASNAKSVFTCTGGDIILLTVFDRRKPNLLSALPEF